MNLANLQNKFYIIPLLLMLAMGFSFFFSGTDTIWYAPSIVFLSLYGFSLLYPGTRNGWSVPKSTTVLLAGILWLYMWLSVSWSSAPYISTLFMFVFSSMPFIFFVTILSSDPQKTAHYNLLAASIMLCGLAVWALIQFFFLFDTYGPRIHHPLLNPNSLAGMMTMGFLPAIAVFMAAEKKKTVLLGALAIILFGSVLVVTKSRGALLASIVTLFIVLPLVTFPFTKQSLQRLFILFVILVAIVAVINTYAIYAQDYNLSRLINPPGKSMTDRGALWMTSLRIFQDNFWGGIGFATFAYAYPSYRLSLDMSDGYFAHMDPLQYGLETGIFTYVTFYLLLIAILLRTIKGIHLTHGNRLARTKIIAPFGGMLALTLHTHMTFHLYILALLIPMGILLAYWYVSTSAVIGDKRFNVSIKNRLWQVTAFAMVLLIAAVPSQWVVRSGMTYKANTRISKAIYAGDYKTAKEELEAIAPIAQDSNFNIHQDEARWRILKLQKEMKILPLAEKKELYKEALVHIDNAIAANKYLGSSKSYKAQIYYLGYKDGGIYPDGLDLAIKYMREALSQNPLLLEVRVRLSMLYEEKGEFKKALNVLESGLEWPRVAGPSDVNFLVRTAKMRLRMGDQAGHDFLINEAGARAQRYGLTYKRP